MQGVSGGVCTFLEQKMSSNLSFYVMLPAMALHHIAMQCRQAHARRDRRTRADTGGHVRTLGATMGRWGGNWGGGMPLYKAMVLFSSSNCGRVRPHTR